MGIYIIIKLKLCAHCVCLLYSTNI
uniref:Uncharacterized protein n=1 Tax=Arundo donax TaxID=35708 RepID=A0A0A8YHG5_ARUDO